MKVALVLLDYDEKSVFKVVQVVFAVFQMAWVAF